jgi:uncharacterized phage-like protein YoqJ
MQYKKEKIVCFAGHRNDWQILGIENNLKTTMENLILKGYTIFYDGNKGAFDKLCSSILLEMKAKYPYIEIYRILSSYNQNKSKTELPIAYDGSIYPDIEQYHPKQKIKKRNEWMVQHCDILVCYIVETYKSGAFAMVNYARKINKPVIYLERN